MIALVDIDSLFYHACYKLDDPAHIEKCGLTGLPDNVINESLAEIGADRLETMLNDILIDITKDENNIEINSVEIYVTHCSNSIRKNISTAYKSDRKPNEIVNCLRKLYISKNEAIYHDSLEADDLVADRARQIGEWGCIIVTMDKDLTQIGGFIYNFYRKPSIKDEYGNDIQTFPRKGLSYTPPFEAMQFLAKQMIQGDSGDKVQGLPKYGEVKAKRIITPCKNKFGLIRSVIKEYQKVYADDYMEHLQINHRLLYLGSL